MTIILFLLLIMFLLGGQFAFAVLEWQRCRGRLASEIEETANREPRPSILRIDPRVTVQSVHATRHTRLTFVQLSRLFVALAAYFVFGTASVRAGELTASNDPAPVRVEFGGFGNGVTQGFGAWYGSNAQVTIRSPRFTPMFTFESQTRPQGTQENYSFFSYMNWSKSFYTVQSISVAPQNVPRAIYYARNRQDVKAFWKLPRMNRLVVDAGWTRFDFGAPGHGQIYNLGALYYRGRLVLEGNLFINRNEPRSLISSSGVASAQFGREGRYWVGATAGGGRELYNYSGIGPIDVKLFSYSFEGFYRRWLTRHTGVKVSFLYLQKLDAYRQTGTSVSMFYEF